jgi:hypothetical protein
MSKFKFGKVAAAMKPAIKDAAIEMMRASKRHFSDAFDLEELGGKPWREVARRTPGTPFYENRVVWGWNKASGKAFKRDQGKYWQTRRILQGTTGRLRYKTVRADSSITNWGAVSQMTNPVPYAAYINDGTKYMVARPFMKHTDELTDVHLYILKQKTAQTWYKSII